MVEDLFFELVQRGSGIDAELLYEQPAPVLIDMEGFGLAAAAVEGEHQLPAQALSEWVLRDERFQLTDQIGVEAERQFRLDPLLERSDAQFLQPSDLGLRERLIRELGERQARARAPTPPAASRPTPPALLPLPP